MPTTNQLRPHHCVPEPILRILCDNCAQCEDACPQGIIKICEFSLLPFLDVGEAGCTFCGFCAMACSTGALSEHQLYQRLKLRPRFKSNCLTKAGGDCTICVNACPRGAIRLVGIPTDISFLTHKQENCMGCGICAAACPQNAIELTKTAVR
ncbi:4Fe-4S binding protein [Pseudovibrio flavus]|uniref:4Fe-4S binding protein n=1 Tax=Pseudovibrio flavus TaxID=2529854 RepID=UPI00211CF299|nr:4Fe-4S binding protein [Pseudovibrio flavus]